MIKKVPQKREDFDSYTVVVRNDNVDGALRPLVDRGGLRADILNNGTIRVGDSIMVVD